MNRNLKIIIFRDWPLHFALVFTYWLPDSELFYQFRGILAKHFLKSCGKNIHLSRDITLNNPSAIEIDNDVSIGKGCVIQGIGKINIDDNVNMGPQCVVSSGKHEIKNGSYRFGEITLMPIIIGEGVKIGAYTRIAGSVCKGKNTIIDISSVVSRGNIPDYSHIGGIPAKPIH